QVELDRNRAQLQLPLHTPCVLSYQSYLYPDPPPPQIYTLSLHDALPISSWKAWSTSRRWPTTTTGSSKRRTCCAARTLTRCTGSDRKSTRLNSSHVSISYAVFCLKKKNKILGSRVLVVDY